MSSRKKGLSSVIGLIFVLIIAIAVLIPFSYLFFSVPSSQTMASHNAQAISDVSNEQSSEIVVIQTSQQLASLNLQASNGPIYYGLVYCRSKGTLYVLLLQNISPSIPLQINSILGFNNGWHDISNEHVIVDADTATAQFHKYKAVAITIPQPYLKIAIVTNYGNMIEVTPYKYIPPIYAKKSGGIIYMDPNSVKVLQQSELETVASSGFLSSTGPVSLYSLVNKYGNALTFYSLDGYTIGSTSSSDFKFYGYYDGPMYTKQSDFTFEGTLNGYWDLPDGEYITTSNGKYYGTITLEGEDFVLSPQSPAYVTVNGNVSIQVTGGSVSLEGFVGNITFSNGTTKNIREPLTMTINAIHSTSIIGKASRIKITNAYLSANSEYLTTTISTEGRGYISGSFKIVNNHQFNSNMVIGNGEFDGIFTIDSSSQSCFCICYPGFSAFQGMVNATLSNIHVPSLNTIAAVTIDTFKVSLDEEIYVIPPQLGAVWLETPLTVQLSFAIANPSNATIVASYAYLYINEYGVYNFFTLLSTGGPQTGSTSGTLAGFVQVDFKSPIEVPPGGFVSKTITVSIPVQPQLFGENLPKPNSRNIINEHIFFQQVYETINFELYTNIGYLTPGTFVIPIEVPMQVQA